ALELVEDLAKATLSGGAGTGISPVLARAAREAGALTVALVTTPFDCEGNRRLKQAREGLESLRAAADGVICVPNQKVFKLIDENTTVTDAFARTTGLVLDGALGFWRLLKHRGLIEIHFDELCGVLRDSHRESSVVAVEAAGPTRAADAAEKLFCHPLMDGENTAATAETVLVSLMGGPDMTMADINRVMERISQHCGRAQITMGAAVDETFRDRLCVTWIAAARAPSARRQSDTASGAKHEAPDLDTQLLEKQTTSKPASRFVPPAPVLTPEQQTRLMTRQSGSRQRKTGPKMRQGQLPLEIVNKGRFDNSEPTIHKGEDLDLPTFIRRGVVLN
ncbi:MAG TPA: hypothetical protein PKA41_18825, partial [Verrucomicrobiota bacterium]|nr:hypothetical protein [Verrucomicrobiota bacterium]